MTIGYVQHLDRLSAEIEFLRLEMAAGIDAGRDIFDLHEAMETARRSVFALAMREHGFDFDSVCADLNEAKRRAQTMGFISSTAHGSWELTH